MVKKQNTKIMFQVAIYIILMTLLVLYLRKKEFFQNKDISIKTIDLVKCSNNCTDDCKNKNLC